MPKAKRKKATRRTYRKPTRKKSRRRRSLREGGLSQMFSPSSVTGAGSALFSGAVGGVLASVVSQKLLTNASPLTRILTLAGTSFAFGSIMKMPNVGAGVAGAIGRELFASPKGMSENTYLSENVDYIKKLPTYLQEGTDLSENVDLSEAHGNYMNMAPAYGM